MAVLVMLPALRRQQPTTPVQKATKSKKNETIKRAIMARPISAKNGKDIIFQSAADGGVDNVRRRAMTSSLPDLISTLVTGK